MNKNEIALTALENIAMILMVIFLMTCILFFYLFDCIFAAVKNCVNNVADIFKISRGDDGKKGRD